MGQWAETDKSIAWLLNLQYEMSLVPMKAGQKWGEYSVLEDAPSGAAYVKVQCETNGVKFTGFVDKFVIVPKHWIKNMEEEEDD